MGTGSIAHNAQLNNNADLFGTPHQLGSYRGGAEGTQVLVLFSLRQDQQQTLAHRCRSATLWAIKFGSLKLFKALCVGGAAGGGPWMFYKKAVLHRHTNQALR